MQIKIATYNVRNLFLGEDIAPERTMKPRTQRSLAALAEVIDRMDADVVSLQELSSKGTLETHLLSRRGLAEKYPHVAYVQGNNPGGLNLGVLSKYPLTEWSPHKNSPVPLADGSGEVGFSHDLMRVDVNLNQDPEPELSVYNTCARSNPEFRKKRSNLPRPAKEGEPGPETRRLSEAQAIRNIAESEMKGSSTVRYEHSLDSDTRWVSSCASDHLPVVSTFEVEV